MELLDANVLLPSKQPKSELIETDLVIEAELGRDENPTEDKDIPESKERMPFDGG